MNQDHNKHEATELDPRVSAHYKSLADESTPAELDRAVMREAARAVQADNRRGSFGAWFRPVAFMATVGLSLAIILDLSDTSIFSLPADMPLETGRPVPVQPAVETAPDNAARNRTATVTADFMRREKSMATQSSKMAAPDAAGDEAGVAAPVTAAAEAPEPDSAQSMRMQSDVAAPGARQEEAPFEDSAAASDVFTGEIESAEKRLQEIAATADATLQTVTAAPAAGAQFGQSQAQDSGAMAAFALVAPLQCSDDQKSDVEEWWKCIETLRQSGLAELAASELDSLREEFPEFKPPE